MQNIKINLKDIPDLKRMIQTVISKSIYKSIQNNSFIINDNISQVIIDFKGSPYIDINTLAYIALFIRNLAESNIRVILNWPSKFKGSPSSMHKYLDNTGFPKLFSAHVTKSNWQNNVISEGSVYENLYSESIASETHYIKFSWFDESIFAYDKNVGIWQVNPILKNEFRDPIEDILLQQGFINKAVIDIFFKVIFKEIGWNIVLHSSNVPGAGYGIFGAQINNKKILTFTLGDLGRSIPFTLGNNYNLRGLKWESKFTVTSKAAIVRYALEKNSSSRPIFPSAEDEKAFRGLALVANSLNAGSELEFISNGGSLIIKGRQPRSKAKVTDCFAENDYPGTFILGTLSQSSDPMNGDSYKDIKPPDEDFTIIRCYSLDGNPIDRQKFRKELKSRTKNINQKITHLDIGFTDEGIRFLEYILIDFIENNGNDCDYLFIWNISSDWSQFQYIFNWIIEQKSSLKFICFINNNNNSYLLNLNNTNKSLKKFNKHFQINNTIQYHISDVKKIDIDIIKINIIYYIEMCAKLNSHYLQIGFKEEDKNNGFYIGDIQLLNTQSVGWFFSLTKNITQNSNSNLTRWVKSCYVGYVKLVSELSEIKDRVLILGFSAPIRPILYELNSLIQENIDIYSILTYDVPTREELSFILKNYSHVILITDVISTGSLIAEIAEIIRNENKKLVGIITLVDALNIKKSFKWNEQIEHLKVELLSFGQMKLPYLKDDDFINAKYWIDPISQIPGERDVLSVDIDHRIEKSINVLSKNKVAKIAHIVDGTRHSSIYFDLKELLKSKYCVEIEKLVTEEIKTRLNLKEWTNEFNPCAIIFPIGTSRIEKISEISLTEKETNSKSATNYYIKLIKNIWPNIEEIQVQRVFEPGGISRCAKIVDVKNTSNIKNDFIIADDSIWSGKTFKSLLELAKSLNARKIIFIPLLARFSKSELNYWESIESFYTGKEKIEVCFIFPLFIPIPFYSNNECPYETTIRRFDNWKEKNIMISSLIDRVVISLKGNDRLANFIEDETYIKYWLKVRTYSELAAENQTALKILIDFIKEANSPFALLALIHVFLHEWHIIGRARLRQTISNEILSKCSDIIKSRQNNIELLISTLSLLRSNFPQKFIEELNKINFQEIKDINLIERITIHLSTLSDQFKKTRKYHKVLQEFTKTLLQLSINFSSSSEPIAKRYAQVLVVLNKINRRSKSIHISLTIKESVNEIFDLILNHYTLRHDTWSFVEQLAGNLSDLDRLTFERYLEKWNNICETIVTEKIFPLLIKIKNVLIIAATPQDSLPTADIEYLMIDEPDEGLINVEDDINIIQTNLKLLIDKPDSKLWLFGVQSSAKRMLESIAGENSLLVGTLKNLKEVSLQLFLQNFQKDLNMRFMNHKSRNLIIEVINNSDSSILDDFIFAPKHLLESCKLNIIDNLYKYAFINNGNIKIQRRINIIINSVSNSNNEKLISLIVKNNGREIISEIKQSEAALRIRNDLIQFGGDFPEPQSMNEAIWKVSQSIIFLLW